MSAESTEGETVNVGGPLSSPPQMVPRWGAGWDGRRGSCILIPPHCHAPPPPSPTSELGKV